VTTLNPNRSTARIGTPHEGHAEEHPPAFPLALTFSSKVIAERGCATRVTFLNRIHPVTGL
jgi:hypothetical protein